MASSKTPAYSTLETENNEPEAQAFEVIGLQSVQVKAPSDLPGGYHLCVEINGTKTLVSVVRTGTYGIRRNSFTIEHFIKTSRNIRFLDSMYPWPVPICFEIRVDHVRIDVLPIVHWPSSPFLLRSRAEKKISV
jgi:hypothetical protein